MKSDPIQGVLFDSDNRPSRLKAPHLRARAVQRAQNQGLVKDASQTPFAAGFYEKIRHLKKSTKRLSRRQTKMEPDQRRFIPHSPVGYKFRGRSTEE